MAHNSTPVEQTQQWSAEKFCIPQITSSRHGFIL